MRYTIEDRINLLDREYLLKRKSFVNIVRTARDEQPFWNAATIGKSAYLIPRSNWIILRDTPQTWLFHRNFRSFEHSVNLVCIFLAKSLFRNFLIAVVSIRSPLVCAQKYLDLFGWENEESSYSAETRARRESMVFFSSRWSSATLSEAL